MTIYIALGLGLLTAVANILGAYLGVIHRHPSRRFMAASIGFSGGFLLAAALLEMVPESLERGTWMPAFIALGYLVVFLAEQFFNVHLHGIPEEVDADWHRNPVAAEAVAPAGKRELPPVASFLPAATGISAVVALNAHDFIDGLAIGAGMVTSASLGLLVFLSVLLHEIPAGFVIASVVRGTGGSGRAAMLAGASLGLITLVGIVIPFLAGGVAGFLTDALLALASGTFIYVGATMLIPLSEAGRSRSLTLMVVLGFVVFFATAKLVETVMGG